MADRILVLGTHNRKKRAEMESLLALHGFALRTLADFPKAIEVVEDGDSFQANATLKAVQQAVHLQHWVLAEDSGLEVDALGGAPGIFSARFAGLGATDAANNARLLEKLSDVPDEKRTASYVCHMTLADPTGRVHMDVEAYCRGRIRTSPCGDGGFGYDPLFEVLEYRRTFGEMSGALKSLISHRARASAMLLRELQSVAMWDAGCRIVE
jgi:XTP/dITP diphosphohydrolase